MRRVAYETLAMRDRRDRHLAAAAYMEEAFPDDDETVEVLASHYLDAYSAAPDAEDAVAIRGRARELTVRAAQRAAALGAPAEAQRYYTQAADLTDAPLEQAGLLDAAGEMALRSAAQDIAAELSERARALYEAAGEVGSAARVTLRLSRIDQAQGRLGDAIERMERAYAVLSAEEPSEDFAMLATRLAGAVYFAGDVPRASELVEQSLDIGEALDLPGVLVRGWAMKGMIGASGRHPEEARGLFQLSLELANRHELREEASRACANLSDLAFRRDRYADALAHLEQAMSLGRMIGSRPHEWFALSESTYPLYMLGRWDEAMAVYEELPEERLPDGGTLLSPLSSILEIHAHRGDLDAARRLLAIYHRLGESADVQERAGYAGATACIRFFEGRHAEAVAEGEQTLEWGRTLGSDGQDVKMGVMWALEAAIALGDRGRRRSSWRGSRRSRPDCGRRRWVGTPIAPAPAWPAPARPHSRITPPPPPAFAISASASGMR